MMNSKTLKLVLGIGVSIVCLAFVFHHIDFSRLTVAWREANHALLLLAIGVYMSSMVVRSLRWKILLRPIKDVPTIRLFPSVIIGYAGNNLIPFRTGEVLRAYASGRSEGISKSASFATIMVERIFDGLTMALLLSVALFSLDVDDTALSSLRYALWLGGAIFGAAFAFCFALIFQQDASLRFAEKIFQFETFGISEKVLGIIHKFITGLEVLKSGKDLAMVLGLSITVWMCEAAMYALTGMALHLELPFFKHVAVLAIINMVIMIPSTPGFAGTFDLAGKKTLTLFGVVPEVALLYTLLVHLGQYLPTTILGLFFMFRQNVSLSAAQSRGAEETSEMAAEGDEW